MFSPSFETNMIGGKGGDGRPLPGKVTLDAICAKNDGCAAIAVTVTSGFELPCIADIKDADGPHEIELRSADIDVRTTLNEPEGVVGGNEIIDWQGLERSTAVGPIQTFKDAASAVW